MGSRLEREGPSAPIVTPSLVTLLASLVIVGS